MWDSWLIKRLREEFEPKVWFERGLMPCLDGWGTMQTVVMRINEPFGMIALLTEDTFPSFDLYRRLKNKCMFHVEQ